MILLPASSCWHSQAPTPPSLALAWQPSYANVEAKWIPELAHEAPGKPWVLVGTKIDLRDDPQANARLQSEGRRMISYDEGVALAQRLGARAYLECSALTQEGLKNCFDSAINVGLQARQGTRGRGRSRNRRRCAIM